MAKQPVVCMAGCGQRVITPPVGVSLAGYFHDRVATSVRDDLMARAMVMEHEGARLALVSCDLICMSEEVAGAAKALIEKEAGIPPERVLIGATHTHTGPEIRPGSVISRNEEYVAGLPRRIADAVGAAARNMFRATLRPGRAVCEGYAFNRLFRMKDGTEVFGRGGDQVVKVAGPVDPDLQTLSVVDEEGRLRAMAVNFALHADVIGGGKADFISADWPGVVAQTVAAVYGQDVVTVFLQGTCGDINHNPHEPTFLPTRGPAKAAQVGRGVAAVAMHASERAEPMTFVRLWGEMRTLTIPYYTREAGLLAQVAELKKKPEADRTPFDRFLIERTEKWPYDGKMADAPIQAMQIGEMAVAGFPAEIFVRIGLEVKSFSPLARTMVVELANARVTNYVPTTDQAERGAYGAKPILSRWLCADAGRRMADAMQAMLWRGIVGPG